MSDFYELNLERISGELFRPGFVQKFGTRSYETAINNAIATNAIRISIPSSRSGVTNRAERIRDQSLGRKSSELYNWSQRTIPFVFD